MFPNGWPGRGLLVLRLCCAGLLLFDGVAGWLKPLQGTPDLLPRLFVLPGVLLLIGLWTPLAALLGLGLELWWSATGSADLRGVACFVGSALALAMLGPGVWSLDAALFGRRRIHLPD